MTFVYRDHIVTLRWSHAVRVSRHIFVDGTEQIVPVSILRESENRTSNCELNWGAIAIGTSVERLRFCFATPN